MEQNTRIYFTEFARAVGMYAAAIGLAVYARPRLEPDLMFIVALLPLIPAGMALRAVLRALGRMDELERRIQLNALALAGGVTACFGLAYAILEMAGMPLLSMKWVWFIFAATWLVGFFLGRRGFQ